jgi:hypothetical protein
VLKHVLAWSRFGLFLERWPATESAGGLALEAISSMLVQLIE